MNYTIVAPEPIMEAWFKTTVVPSLKANRPVTLVGDGSRRHNFISITDVAEFITSSVGNPSARNAYLPIGGPKALGWTDIMEAFESALGKKIPVIHAPPGTEIPGVPKECWN
jgi:nucleoside-diphosphate-sugar epimerase